MTGNSGASAPPTSTARSASASPRLRRLDAVGGEDRLRQQQPSRRCRRARPTSVTAATTSAFAASTRPRRGVAVSVRRIMPAPYSDVAALTPSARKSSALGEPADQRDADRLVVAAVGRVPVVPGVADDEREQRAQGERRAAGRARPSPWSSAATRASSTPSAAWRRTGSCRHLRPVLDAVVGQLHERGLEARAPRRQLVQRARRARRRGRRSRAASRPADGERAVVADGHPAAGALEQRAERAGVGRDDADVAGRARCVKLARRSCRRSAARARSRARGRRSPPSRCMRWLETTTVRPSAAKRAAASGSSGCPRGRGR